MKKFFFFWLCSLVISQLFAQPFEKKQITNFDFDSKGASFPFYSFGGISSMRQSPIFFEAYQDSSINIMMMNYDSVTDSFSSAISITQNEFKNLNPIAYAFDYYPNEKINLIWQTNENGNWDIAKITLSDSGWTHKEFLLNSLEEEINPSFIIPLTENLWYDNEIEFLYEKNNSVYLYHQKDTIVSNEVVFEGNDTIIYTHPTGAYVYRHNGSYQPDLYVAISEKKQDGKSLIKYRKRSVDDSSWSDALILYDSVYADNPRFFKFRDGVLLSFEIITNEIKRVNFFTFVDQYGHNWEATNLIDDPTVQCSDFTLHFYAIRTLKENKINSSFITTDFDTFLPFSFKRIIKDDLVFIECKFCSDSQLHLTKVHNTKIGLGNLGIEGFMAVSYTIWEDSSNGHINLFGVKRLDPLGDVNDKIMANNFILYQNYPNPFNPNTIIKIELLSREFVTLRVYDVLGSEVATLVNEEREAGVYKTAFDGINLASGIYVYRLSVGKNNLSRKMILLK